MEQIKALGGHIAARRKALGMTQEQLAAMLGISAPAVSKWETGSSYPDITLLCPLARALETNVDTLLQFEDTLPEQQVIEAVNGIMEQASQGAIQAAEAQLQALLRQYPNCTALQFNAAAVYAGLRMLCPQADARRRTDGGRRAKGCWRRYGLPAAGPIGRPPRSSWRDCGSPTEPWRRARPCCGSCRSASAIRL